MNFFPMPKLTEAPSLTIVEMEKKKIPNETLGSSIEPYTRYRESLSEEKNQSIFQTLSFQAIIIYFDVFSLINFGNTQKLAKKFLRSTQCIGIYDRIYNINVLFYMAAYNKLIEYIKRRFVLTLDLKQSTINNDKLSLYQADSNFLINIIDNRRARLNEHLQNIFEILNRFESQETGCVILLKYIGSIILNKKEDIEFRRMLADFVENTDFLASPVESEENTQILKTDQAIYARQVFFKIKKAAKDCPHPPRVNFVSSQTLQTSIAYARMI